MKFLITGASGFIGAKLVEELSKREIRFDTVIRSSGSQPQGRVGNQIHLSWPEGISNLDLSPYTAVIHLAHAPVNQSANLDHLRKQNVTSVASFLQRITQSNPACSFIFVTSQSAKAEAESVYGKLKWEAEKLIRQHSGMWTILRPGLVVGPGGKGLFSKMLSVVAISPVVPLIGNGSQLVQPIGLSAVVEALITVSENAGKYTQKEYSLVGPPVPMKTLLQQAAAVISKKRIYLCVPLPIVDFGLSLLEKIFANPPITKTNLLGLLHLDVLDSRSACEALHLQLPSLEKMLESELTVTTNSALEREAHYLHRKLFGRVPDRRLIDRYVLAHEYCCFARSAEQQINISDICQYNLDAEAIEFATRSRKTLLTKKFILLSYLGEVEAKNYSHYVNQRYNVIAGFGMLGIAVLRAPWKLIKGKYLIWRYGLV